VCVAKTASSLSHDATLQNRPQDFIFPIDDVRLYAGAGYILALAGSVMTMPGLPEVPGAESVDVDDEGRVTGL
jgi:formate--tetrahydrofolate ligase